MMYLLDIEFWFWQFFFSPYFNSDQLLSGFLMRNLQSFKFLFHYKQHMFLSSCFDIFFIFSNVIMYEHGLLWVYPV